MRSGQDARQHSDCGDGPDPEHERPLDEIAEPSLEAGLERGESDLHLMAELGKVRAHGVAPLSALSLNPGHQVLRDILTEDFGESACEMGRNGHRRSSDAGFRQVSSY